MGDTRGSGHFRSDQVLLGWRYAVLVPDPGPAPRRPAPASPDQVSAEWIATERDTEAATNRPLRVALAVAGAAALLLVLSWLLSVLPGLFAGVGLLCCLLVALVTAFALWQGSRALGARIDAERVRLAGIRGEAEQRLRERQVEHARAYTEWQTRRQAYEAQPRWYPVSVPVDTPRIDVVGGSAIGWSALLTAIGASCLRDGGDITVVDLSGGVAAGELVSLARRCGTEPRVWVLPADLPRLDLGTRLSTDATAEVLATVASASEPGEGRGSHDRAANAALLKRMLGALGADAGIASLVAALRAVATRGYADGDGLDPSSRPLSARQRADLRVRFGSDRSAVERAWALEERLAAFEGIASRVTTMTYPQVKVIATDRTSGEHGSRVFGSYLAAALTQLLDELSRRNERRPEKKERRWAHTIVVCGAESLGLEPRAALRAAAARARAGLVLAYRALPDEAASRLGQDGAATVVMRVDEPGSAKAALDHLGPGLRLPVHRLTEVLGAALSDTIADSYVSDTGDVANAVTAPLVTSSARKKVAPLDLARQLRAATMWGRITAQAAEVDASPAPVRELRIDRQGLAGLAPTAMIVSHGATVALADANPGILGLPTATLSDTLSPSTAGAGGADTPPPNLGPPPERLDWRPRGAHPGTGQ